MFWIEENAPIEHETEQRQELLAMHLQIAGQRGPTALYVRHQSRWTQAKQILRHDATNIVHPTAPVRASTTMTNLERASRAIRGESKLLGEHDILEQSKRLSLMRKDTKHPYEVGVAKFCQHRMGLLGQ